MKNVKNKKTSHSKEFTNILQLNQYENTIKVNDLNDTVNRSKAYDANSDIKGTRKIKTELNKHIQNIKSVHKTNVAAVNNFKNNIINKDKQIAQEYLDIVMPEFIRHQEGVNQVKLQKLEAENKVHNNVSSLIANYKNKLNKCTTENELKGIAKDIKEIIDAIQHWNQTPLLDISEITQTFTRSKSQDILSNLLTSMQGYEVDAAKMYMDIKNGGKYNVKDIPEVMGEDSNQTNEEGESYSVMEFHDNIVKMIQSSNTPGRGWTITNGVNGISIYQDPNSKLSLQEAVRLYSNNNNGQTL